jgi:peptide/nickel transport system permease protein
MRQYIIRRLLISIIVLIGVSILLYVLARSMPADYVTLSTSTSPRITEDQRQRLREIYGLNKSIPAGYLGWLGSALKFDLGTSLVFSRPVAEIIKERIGVTFFVSATALLFELLLGVPLGILAARRRNTRTDYIITAFVFMGISLPSFFFAAVLKRVFGFYGLNWLPSVGMLNPKIIYSSFNFAKFIDYLKHLILPITTFVLTGAGSWLRYTRANMIEALESDYVRTARAKGVPERRVVYQHAYRNTLIPIITLLGASLPSLFSGAMITENLFGLPGIGVVALEASFKADLPFLLGYNMLLAVLTVLGYLLSDILYAVADPRIRLS